MTRTKEHRIEPGYFDATEAARYLGVSVSFFEDHVRTALAVHDFRAPGSKKPMLKYTRADLDAWAGGRRREKLSA